eukprot:570984-Rhodomonas_salina.3
MSQRAKKTPRDRRAWSKADFKSLEVEPVGDLEWKISAISASWLLAGREIKDEDPSATQSDILAVKIRAAGLAVYGAVQVFGCGVGIFTSVINANPKGRLVCMVQVLAAGVVLVLTHIANRSRMFSLLVVVEVSACALAAVCLFGATFFWPLIQSLQGWHWRAGVVVWQWASAMGPVLLSSNPVRTGTAVFMITVALDTVLIVSGRLWRGKGGVNVVEEDTDKLLVSIVNGFTTFAILPPVVAVLFRVSKLLAVFASLARSCNLASQY